LRKRNEAGPSGIYEKGFANRGDVIVKKPGSINPDMVIDEIMRRWPATVAVVLRYRMLCVGCPIGTFHTVTEACREHQINEGDFLVALESAVRGER
jgi:hybrid cluster-associated redox disulfide protein